MFPIALVVLVLTAIMDYVLCLKCYKCSSKDSSDCKADELGKAKDFEVDCDSGNNGDFAAYLKQQGLDMSHVPPHQPSSKGQSFCPKLIFEKDSLVVRSCLLLPEGANFSEEKLCELIKKNMKDVTCNLCKTDLCNGGAAAEVAATFTFAAVLVYFNI